MARGKSSEEKERADEMAPGQQYDVDAKERELIKRRAQMRDALKQEFMKQVTNPHRHGTGEGGYVFDPAIQRFMSMKATRYDYFKPTFIGFAKWFGVIVVPIGLFAYVLRKDRKAFEDKCRRGEISYRERSFKFNG